MYTSYYARRYLSSGEVSFSDEGAVSTPTFVRSLTGGVYAYFQAGSSRIELLKADYFASSLGSAKPAPMQGDHRGVIVFKVDDVDATYADLVKRGAPTLAEPQDRPQWFCRTAHLLAPDGYVLEVFKTLTPLPWEAEPVGP